MRMIRTPLFLAITGTLAIALLAGCNRDDAAPDTTAATPPAADSPAVATADPAAGPGYDAGTGADPAAGSWPAASAAAMLMSGTGPAIEGTLTFDVADGGVRITGTMSGFEAGATHALHVHENGSCNPPTFESAGAHLNPDGAPHGHPERGAHHAGDIPNQTADAEGAVAVDQVVTGLTIGDGGANDVVGKAVVVHAGSDDYTTQPSGASGDRIACGVISLMTAPPAPGA